MRIPIREQLGCLVLFASTIGLAVIAIATWLTNHSFVLGIRSGYLRLLCCVRMLICLQSYAPFSDRVTQGSSADVQPLAHADPRPTSSKSTLASGRPG